jgi:hypothetical protein
MACHNGAMALIHTVFKIPLGGDARLDVVQERSGIRLAIVQGVNPIRRTAIELNATLARKLALFILNIASPAQLQGRDMRTQSATEVLYEGEPGKLIEDD